MTPRSTFDLDGFELQLATETGPRIVGLRRNGGAQIFADLPDLMLTHPGIPDYALLGGHRLWRAPEIPVLTYEPDGRPVTIETAAWSLTVEGAAESDGLVKSIVIDSRDEFLIVDHSLRNDAWAPIECAAWAITQLIPGGTAVLPQTLEPADDQGVQPNRSVVLWPYTDPGAPEIVWRRDAVLIAGSTNPAPLKVGQRNDRGWIAYAVADELFVKWAALHVPDRRYLDLDATMQIYRNDQFVELETMGPPQVIAPGHSISHREVWAIYEMPDVGPTDLMTEIARLDLPAVPSPT